MIPSDPSAYKYRLAYANIMGTPKMSQDKVHADLSEIKVTGASFGGLVEMKWPSYWKALASVFPKKNWGRYPKRFALNRGQVIFWDYSKWVNIENRTRTLHGPSKFSATRKIRAVHLESATDPTEHCWVVLTHFLPRQWNPKYRPSKRDLWLKAEMRLKDTVKDLDGPVYVLMDQNRKKYNMFEGQYFGPVGVDITMVMNTKETHYYAELNLNSDHDARIISRAQPKRQWSA